MVSLVFHPVWDHVLDPLEKEVYTKAFQTIELKAEEFYASPMRIKQKRNNGLVATVFLVNTTNEMIETEYMSVEIIDKAGNLIAIETFNEALSITPESALPWSFVFGPNNLDSVNVAESTVKITLKS